MDLKLRFHTLFISAISLLSSATSFSCHPSGPHLWLFDAYVNHNLSFLCSMLFLAHTLCLQFRCHRYSTSFFIVFF